MAAAPMTTAEAAQHRELCEQMILRQLRALSELTGLDMCRVEVFLVVRADECAADASCRLPRRRPEAVRIELAV
jgi:hypothetical protein